MKAKKIPTKKKRTKGKSDTKVKINKKAERRLTKEAGDRTTFFFQ
jgi:hypothetical protein